MPIQNMREVSPAFRHALLKSERKRITAAIAFVATFAVLMLIRIFILGSAMSRWGLLASALFIGYEILILGAVKATRPGESSRLWSDTNS